MRMTTEEAFVKVLQMHGIEHAFGIIGSAFMPISDLFPRAGITFWDCAHETNAGLICDGYSRVTGKMGMAIAQNGPGVTGFVTAVKTAYWNHTPMLLVTPQAAAQLSQTITPVNSFRVIFDEIFGGSYGQLPDVSYFSTETEEFDFVIVPNTWASNSP